MAGISEKPEIEIEEYEEIVGNWDQASVQEGDTDIRAVSIQDPTSDEQFNSMTHTERPALRPETNRKELCRRTKRVAYGGRQTIRQAAPAAMCSCIALTG